MDHNIRSEVPSSTDSSDSTQLLESVSVSPPPSYEHVLAESQLEECAEAGDKREGQEEKQGEGDEEDGENNPDTSTDDATEIETQRVPEEIYIFHKSSKELYKALAAQWGITCKMSDHCRCYDCQSHYFDCEYDRDNDHEKTDGGLGAGTPMFISEVMHGTACTIL